MAQSILLLSHWQMTSCHRTYVWSAWHFCGSFIVSHTRFRKLINNHNRSANASLGAGACRGSHVIWNQLFTVAQSTFPVCCRAYIQHQRHPHADVYYSPTRKHYRMLVVLVSIESSSPYNYCLKPTF